MRKIPLARQFREVEVGGERGWCCGREDGGGQEEVLVLICLWCCGHFGCGGFGRVVVCGAGGHDVACGCGLELHDVGCVFGEGLLEVAPIRVKVEEKKNCDSFEEDRQIGYLFLFLRRPVHRQKPTQQGSKNRVKDLELIALDPSMLFWTRRGKTKPSFYVQTDKNRIILSFPSRSMFSKEKCKSRDRRGFTEAPKNGEEELPHFFIPTT